MSGGSPDGNQHPRLISIADAAELRGVCPKTIRRWVAAGILPAYRTGPRLVRIDPADLARLDRRLPTASDR